MCLRRIKGCLGEGGIYSCVCVGGGVLEECENCLMCVCVCEREDLVLSDDCSCSVCWLGELRGGRS